jgi:hypothetical protein
LPKISSRATWLTATIAGWLSRRSVVMAKSCSADRASMRPMGLHAILIADVGGDRRRCDEQTGAGLPEGLEQRAVVEFADDARMQAAGFQPLFEARPDRHVVARHEKRSAVQQGRKFSVQGLDQAWAPKTVRSLSPSGWL